MKKNRENIVVWAVEEEVKIKAYRAQRGESLDVVEFSEDGLNMAVALGH